ncbi:acyl-CoA thioesterase [Rhodobacterales bacterium HKCCE3408]|nr:acyl-CoA thioesterase [Rhodobacterales bacterium HKCCE3408]
MAFDYHQKVLFRHCDPAGIVFFPRYAEMVNDAVEALFSDVLGWPFEAMHPDAAVPTVAIAMEFSAPSRHGDELILSIAGRGVGRTSLTLETTARAGDEVRFRARQTLVCIGSDGKPQPWPDAVRAAAERMTEEQP